MNAVNGNGNGKGSVVGEEQTGWGSNFWVTLVDPQVCFYPFLFHFFN